MITKPAAIVVLVLFGLALEQVEKVKAQAQRVKAPRADAKASPGELVFDGPASYWIDLHGYDPATEVRALKQPMILLQGKHDYPVTLTDFARWKDAWKNRTDVKFRSLPPLNHLFQAGEGESTPAEYQAKPDHMSPEVIDKIATWVRKNGT